MKLVCISDTHNQHDFLELPEGDVLIHSGDWTGTGTTQQVIKFIRWFASQPHPHKVLVAGNHDITLDLPFYQVNHHRFHKKKPHDAHHIKSYVLREEGIHYLEDSSVTIDGVKFYGSPITPTFCNWAFNVDRGLPIRAVWSGIPEDTDVLITHGPPYGIGDEIPGEGKVGCHDLLKRVREVKPKVHVFGHIHEGYGVYEHEGTTFINPSSCCGSYQLTNKPIEWRL